ncbi:diacylglycerol kinase family protein [Methylocapsa palsarum]|uniref:Diacylglycerol kinase catalytic domain-containing protein n=1 Tax=Methylocapsa palsarum TaxID=1612308 RepID=A0A1I4AP34_9HYPH|nr:diacylglycerol kinase family protein [Methylocapsa palsarum]SFK58043.1 Diacylglycerol kinase catalytic domain-containing protein [Methylocapsa palsarum]
METPKLSDQTVRIRRIEAIINNESGGVNKGAADTMKSLASDLGISIRVSSVESNEVERAVRGAVDSGPDLVAVLAGDGTARLAAELCGDNDCWRLFLAAR